MTSNQETTNQLVNQSTKEFVRRLTISPLDTVYISTLEGSINKRLMGYVDNHNTGVRKMDLIVLPHEHVMITRKQLKDVVSHTSQRVFRFNNKTTVEIPNYNPNLVFTKVDLDDSYVSEINQRFLNIMIGEENLVFNKQYHMRMSFIAETWVAANVFKSNICYKTNGTSLNIVKTIEWTENWEAGDNNFYMFIPFANNNAFRVIAQSETKLKKWMDELILSLKEDGINLISDQGDSKWSLEYNPPAQLFNVK